MEDLTTYFAMAFIFGFLVAIVLAFATGEWRWLAVAALAFAIVRRT